MRGSTPGVIERWLALGAALGACSDPAEEARRPAAALRAWQAQYRGDPQRRGVAPAGARLDGPLRLVWRTPALGIGGYTAAKSSPAVDDEAVYVGEDDGRLYAIDRVNGAVAWAFTTRRHDEEARDPPADGAFTGIHGSPACDEERVYVGDYAGWLYAVDNRTGELVWEASLGGSIGASPLLVEDALYIAVEEPDPDGRVVGVRPTTGEVTYRSDWLGHHPHSSVSWLSGALFVGSNGGVLRRFDPPAATAVFAAQTGGPIKSTAAVVEEGDAGATAYFTSFDGRLYAVNADRGATRFEVETEAESLSSPAVVEDRVVFGSHDGRVRCVDAATGALHWSFVAGAWVASSPTVVPSSRLVVVGTNAGEVLGLDLDRGEVRFRVILDAPVTSGPVAVDRSLFVNDDAGTVYRFDGI